jgi:DNA-binding LacI/PurR family transcriptional regulator
LRGIDLVRRSAGNSSIPKHQHVADYIKSRISEGKYRIGEILPGERVLADELSVSRPSVKRAIKTLEAEGIIECSPSIGSIVRRQVEESLLVGYLVPDLQDPFHLELIRELDSLLHRHHGSLLVQQGIDDARLTGTGLTHLVKHHMLFDPSRPDRVPTVYTGPVSGPVSSIVVDVDSGIRKIYAHLKGLGHSRIAYASPFPAAQDSLYGSLTAVLREDGLTLPSERHFAIDPLDRHGCNELVRTIQSDPAPPTALVCYNDWLAIAISRAARELGLDIPGRLSITGYDDLYVASLLQCPLTTVRFSRKESARRIVDILMRGGLTEHVTEVVETRLIVRESTRAPARDT